MSRGSRGRAARSRSGGLKGALKTHAVVFDPKDAWNNQAQWLEQKYGKLGAASEVRKVEITPELERAALAASGPTRLQPAKPPAPRLMPFGPWSPWAVVTRADGTTYQERSRSRVAAQ